MTQQHTPEAIRELHRKVLELELPLERIAERIAAHKRAAIEHEQGIVRRDV